MSRRTRIDSARLFLRAKTIRPAVARADSSAMQATSYCLFGGDDLNGSQLHNARDWRPMSLYSVREYGRSPAGRAVGVVPATVDDAHYGDLCRDIARSRRRERHLRPIRALVRVS